MPIDLFSRPLPPGSPAPDFTLADQDGNLVNLASLRGSNVILVFYPKDETPVCRQQLCEFRDRFAITAAKDIRVFGVNAGSAQSHAGFRRNNSLPFPLLVDEGGRVAGLYKAKGLWTRRTVYLIDKEGQIRYSRRGKPAPEEVLAAAS